MRYPVVLYDTQINWTDFHAAWYLWSVLIPRRISCLIHCPLFGGQFFVQSCELTIEYKAVMCSVTSVNIKMSVQYYRPLYTSCSPRVLGMSSALRGLPALREITGMLMVGAVESSVTTHRPKTATF